MSKQSVKSKATETREVRIVTLWGTLKKGTPEFGAFMDERRQQSIRPKRRRRASRDTGPSLWDECERLGIVCVDDVGNGR